MQTGSIVSQLILSKVLEEKSAIVNMDFSAMFFSESLTLLKNQFPMLNEQDLILILTMILESMQVHNQDNVELLATVPPSFETKVKRINNVVNELIDLAQKSIIITGYSVSNFVDELIDKIIAKSKRGVFVRVYLNNMSEQHYICRLISHKSKFLKVYNYTNINDQMAALHAKIVSIDGVQNLVSSANLSYHGLSENIEIGCLINSAKFASDLNELFKVLLFSKVFVEV